MPRRKRLDHPGAWHLVMHRGAAAVGLFRGDDDCALFLDELEAVTQDSALEVHAYALSPGELYLLVRSVRGNLAEAMQRLTSRFTQRRNLATRRTGPIFRGRYQSQLIGDLRYLPHLLAFVHLAPVKARGLKKPDESSWTSHRAYIGVADPPPWLSMRKVQSELGSRDSIAAWIDDLLKKKEPWPDELDPETGRLQLEATRRGRKPRVPVHDRAGPKQAAEDVIARVVDITGATLQTLALARRGRSANPARRFAALMLARHSSLTHAQIARRLGGSAGWVAQIAFRHNQALPADLVAWVQMWDRGAFSEAREPRG